MLVIKNLSVTIGKDSTLERRIIQNLNLTVQLGEYIVLIGSNGSGKTTLLNTISGDIKPDEGTITIDGVDITQWPSHKKAALIAHVIQDPRAATIDTMTIEENLSFAYLRGKKRTFLPHKRAERIILFKKKLTPLGIGLEERLDEYVGNLSGGQRQILSLVMATLADSKILLLDEITAALDPKMASLVMELTAHMVQKFHYTTIMITHNMSHALQYGNRTILLQEGHIIREYNAQEKKQLKPIELAAVFDEI